MPLGQIRTCFFNLMCFIIYEPEEVRTNIITGLHQGYLHAANQTIQQCLANWELI